jgi:hypothetical protein
MVKEQTSSVHVKVSSAGKAPVNVTVNFGHKQDRRQLRFHHGNAKLNPAILTFSLPAGHACPHASACRSAANRDDGTIQDGPQTEYRCYAATMEARHSSVRRSRWLNWQALRACESQEEMTQLILDSLTPFAGVVRVHDSGDFFSQRYFDAWMEVARQRPHTVFYAYTKGLPYWVRRLDEVGTGLEPGPLANLVLTASYGGTHDHLIEEYGVRYSRVVFSEDEARDLGLELDHDDSLAVKHGPSFSLLIHGTQPAGTPAAKAVAALRAIGEFGYGAKADAIRREHGRLPLRVIW